MLHETQNHGTPEQTKSNMTPKRKGPSHTLSLTRVSMVASLGVSVLISSTPKTLRKGRSPFSVQVLQQAHCIITLLVLKGNLQNRENYFPLTDEGSKRYNNLQSHCHAFN